MIWKVPLEQGLTRGFYQLKIHTKLSGDFNVRLSGPANYVFLFFHYIGY